MIPLPADAARCVEAMLSLRGAPMLTGARGSPSVDIDGAASLAARVGSLLLESRLDLIELNPAIAHPGGCVAVDALART